MNYLLKPDRSVATHSEEIYFFPLQSIHNRRKLAAARFWQPTKRSCITEIDTSGTRLRTNISLNTQKQHGQRNIHIQKKRPWTEKNREQFGLP